MGCRTLLATVGILAAQSAYRPWVLGLTPLQPISYWGMRHPFPKGARFSYSIGAIGAKEYYDRSGTFGWYIFFQAVPWLTNREILLSDALRIPITSDSSDLTKLRLPFSNVGGIGLVFRRKFSPRAFLTVAADVRITYVSYRQWSLELPSGTQYNLLIESNSFIGFGVTPTLWFQTKEEEKTLVGVGLAYPIMWGRSSYYTVTKRPPDGQITTERHSYYIVPRYVEVRLVVSFIP